MANSVPGVLLTSTNETFAADEFKMGVFESIVLQVTGIKITHEFVKPGAPGVKDSTRWGYRIKGILPGTVFRTYVPALKLADGLRAALAAGGVSNNEAVVPTEHGLWVDGTTIVEFIDSICKKEAPDVDEDQLRANAKNHGIDLTSQKMHKLEIDWKLPSAKAFMDSVKEADFSKGGRKI